MINIKDSYFKYINALIKVLRSRNVNYLHKIYKMMKVNRVLTLSLRNSRALSYKRFYKILIILKSAHVIFAAEKNFKLYYINNYIN